MTRDLHSAILLCAFLTSQARINISSPNHAVCYNTKSIFSTLLQTKNTRARRTGRLFRSTAGSTVLNTSSWPSFFDPSYVPLDYRLKNTLKVLQRAGKMTPCASSLFSSKFGQSCRCSRHRQTGHYRRSQPRVVSSALSGFSRPLSVSTTKKPDMPTRGTAGTGNEESSDSVTPLEVVRQRAVQEALQTLRPLLRGETDMNLHGQSIFPVIKRLVAGQVDHEDLHIPEKLRLCLAYLVTTVYLTDLDKDIKDGNFEEFTTTTPASPPGFVANAKRLFDTIKHSDIEGKGGNLLYTFVKAQLSSFYGNSSEAEQDLRDLLAMDLMVTQKWLLLFTIRLHVLMKMQYRGPDAAIQFLMHIWSGVKDYLVGGVGISANFITRTHGDSLRRTVFTMLDRVMDLRAWYHHLIMEPSPDDSSLPAWSREDHHHLGLLLLSYCCSRLKTPEPSTTSLSATSDLRTAFPQIYETMKAAKYNIPNRLLIRCSFEASRIGNIEYAEELRAHYHHQTARPDLEGGVNYDAYSAESSLVQTSQTGDVLRAIDSIGILQSAGRLQKKDIRNWILTYLHAPSYDLQSPSKLPSLLAPKLEPRVENGEPIDAEKDGDEVIDDPESDTFDLFEVGDRIDDAEEIFYELLLPQRPTVRDYSTIINAFSRRGDIDKVNFWIEMMVDDGHPSEVIPWESALRVFSLAGNARAVSRILQHMHEIARREREKATNASPSLITSPTPGQPAPMSPSVFNILMDLMVQRHDPENADKLWDNGVVKVGIVPNCASVIKLLRAHASAGQWHRVVQIWEFLEQQETSPISPKTWLGEVKERNDKDALFWGTRDPVVQARSMTTLFNIILQAHIALGTPFNTVERLFFRMTKDAELAIEPDAFTMTLMVISASDACRMEEALEYFRLLDQEEHKRGIVSVQRLESHPILEGTDLDVKKSRKRRVDYRPIFALSYLMSGYLRSRDMGSAEWVWRQIIARGLRPTPFTYTLIVKSFVKQSRPSGSGDENLLAANEFITRLEQEENGSTEAPRRFKKTTLRGIGAQRTAGSHLPEMVFAPLIGAYGARKDLAQVKILWSQMVKIGGDVSISGLTLLMDAYRKVGDAKMVVGTWRRVIKVAKDLLKEEAETEEQLFRLMGSPSTSEEESINDEDQKPDAQENSRRLRVSRQHRAILCFPFSIFMDALSAAGRHEEVAEEWSYLRNTGFAFDSHNWNHLVIALIRAGEVERAFEVVEDVILPYGDASYQALYDAQDRSQGDLGAGEARYSRRIGRMRVFSSDEAQAALKPLLASHALKNADGTDVGFAHELKVLHPLTGPWTAWKPHKRVMKVLGDALLSLEHGDMILPVQGEDMLDTSLRDVVDNPTHARKLFTRILTKYPTAAKLAYDFRQGNL